MRQQGSCGAGFGHSLRLAWRCAVLCGPDLTSHTQRVVPECTVYSVLPGNSHLFTRCVLSCGPVLIFTHTVVALLGVVK